MSCWGRSGSSVLEFGFQLDSIVLPKYIGWFKKWSQRACTSCRRYGLNSKRRLNTRQTVGYGIQRSLLALRVDLRGLRSKLSSILLTFSCDTRGRPELLPLHRQPICSNWWFQRQMLFLVGGWNVESKTKRTLHSSRRLSFNELTNAKILCSILAILLSTDAAARLCARREL